nr:ISL3 family transposase [Advenella kashmirensis]
MSPADAILGLTGVVVQRVQHQRDIHVWARPGQRPPCLYCRQGPVRIKATYQRTLKHTRLGNRLMIVHLSVPKYHCTTCNRYFRHRFVGIDPRRRATEAYRLEVFEAHDGGVSQRRLSTTHRIGSATVERWYQSFVKQRVSELSGRSCPQVLGIDEHFFSRKHGYATTLVDLKNHKVFDVVLGRSEASLRSFLKRLPGKEQVRVIVMDLSETYRQIARQYFPNAIIVADRFHVVRLVNQHFMKLWQQHDPEGRKNRGLISLMRRHHWKLSSQQKERLEQYLAQYPVLRSLYVARQQLNGFLVQKNIRQSRPKSCCPGCLRCWSSLPTAPRTRWPARLSPGWSRLCGCGVSPNRTALPRASILKWKCSHAGRMDLGILRITG